jgi:NAD(P)-dependent dehydrogenase (short-subunit alcohol dehydrogenase family)
MALRVNGSFVRFANKVAIITGALGGIGRACAQRLAAEGATLSLTDLSLEHSQEFSAELRKLGAADVLISGCDVSSERAVVDVCAATEERFGRLDALVNVAGMMIYSPIEELTAEDWHHVYGVNLVGAAIFTREAFRRMKSGGAIVNVSSIHAYQTSAFVGPYAAAKAALASLTRTSSIEGLAKGIRANAVLPGAIDTPMLWASPNIKSGVEVLEPRDIGKPEDVAAAVAYLASDEARFVTGASLSVDGGRLARL